MQLLATSQWEPKGSRHGLLVFVFLAFHPSPSPQKNRSRSGVPVGFPLNRGKRGAVPTPKWPRFSFWFPFQTTKSVPPETRHDQQPRPEVVDWSPQVAVATARKGGKGVAVRESFAKAEDGSVLFARVPLCLLV